MEVISESPVGNGLVWFYSEETIQMYNEISTDKDVPVVLVADSPLKTDFNIIQITSKMLDLEELLTRIISTIISQIDVEEEIYDDNIVELTKGKYCRVNNKGKLEIINRKLSNKEIAEMVTELKKGYTKLMFPSIELKFTSKYHCFVISRK